jgi:maltose alpha-D-glucosyltransferase/alpha-amylase
MLATRKTSRAFGRGTLEFLGAGNRRVLAYLRELGDEAILCVANLSRSAQPVELDLKRFKGRVPVEMLGRTAFPPIGERFYLFTLPAYGFYWFRLASDATPPDWHTQVSPPQEHPMLVLFDSWTSFFREAVLPWRIGMAEKLRARLETEVLPRFLEAQRWYAQKGEALGRAVLRDHAVWSVGPISWLIAFVDVKDSLYFLPLALAWEEEESR